MLSGLVNCGLRPLIVPGPLRQSLAAPGEGYTWGMATLPLDIVIWPAPVLAAPTARVEAVGDDIRAIVAEMRRILFTLRGVGLAAPQVGVSQQIMLVCPSGSPGDEQVILNPEILGRSGSNVADEGCLSLPGLYGPVERATTIQVRYETPQGERLEETLTDFPARVFQHEFDHLQGVMFIERMTPEARAKIDAQLTAFREAAATRPE